MATLTVSYTKQVDMMMQTTIKTTVNAFPTGTKALRTYLKATNGDLTEIGSVTNSAGFTGTTPVYTSSPQAVIALGTNVITKAFSSTSSSDPSIDATGEISVSSINLEGGGGGGGGAVCFLGSAPVLTPTGWARIDSLAVGDLVRTADGRDVPVVRAKHQRIEVPSAAVNPYVIPKGQWGATENLAISPRHCVAVPGRGMVEARELGLRQMSMRAAFDYYNLELPEWDNMVVAGVEVESLAPKKRVVMTVEQLAKLAAGKPIEKLAKLVTVLDDGRVAVQMTRKERRMKA